MILCQLGLADQSQKKSMGGSWNCPSEGSAAGAPAEEFPGKEKFQQLPESRDVAELLQKAPLCEIMVLFHSVISWAWMSVLLNHAFLLTVLATFKEYRCVTSLSN